MRGEDGHARRRRGPPRRRGRPGPPWPDAIISRLAKALCPSFMWMTDGSIPHAVQRPHAADAQQAPPDGSGSGRRRRRAGPSGRGPTPSSPARWSRADRASSARRPPSRPERAGYQCGSPRRPATVAELSGSMTGSIGSSADVGVRIGLLLPAVVVEALAEVSLVVQDADADQRDAQVAGALEVVAGQHAKAAGVDRQALVQAELHREVGHRARSQGRGVDRPPRLLVLQILLQPSDRVVDPRAAAPSRRPAAQVARARSA